MAPSKIKLRVDPKKMSLLHCTQFAQYKPHLQEVSRNRSLGKQGPLGVDKEGALDPGAQFQFQGASEV